MTAQRRTALTITLQAACLRWARARANLTVEELAKKLSMKKVDKIVAWERSGEISWSYAEKLASATHTPFGYLFLPEPPVEKLPISDFRTVKTQEIARPSPELIDVVHDALLRQDWYRNYILSSGGGELPFVGSLKPSTDIVRVAEQIRKVIRWDTALPTKTPTLGEMLSLRIRAVEDAGILVMRSTVVGNSHRKLSVEEFRGFALSDKYAPLIFINGDDAKAAQMFTLAHELVHIWLGVSGISNLSQTYSLKTNREKFCNAIAGELLVPTEKLKELWPLVEDSMKGIGRLTRVFKVSSLVVLRRLRDIEGISEKEFQFWYTNEVDESRHKQKASTGGGDFYRTLEARLGTRFASALVESTLDGGTPYREAIRLMGANDTDVVRKLAFAMGIVA